MNLAKKIKNIIKIVIFIKYYYFNPTFYYKNQLLKNNYRNKKSISKVFSNILFKILL